jgi:NAD(P)H-hydrate epimerase
MKVARVEENRRATEEFGIAQDLLMENAGQAVYFVMLQELGIKDRKFVVFCGSGNNGGDGLVVARKIHSNGGEVKVFLLDDEAKFKGAAKKNFDIVSRMPIETSRISSIDSVLPELLYWGGAGGGSRSGLYRGIRASQTGEHASSRLPTLWEAIRFTHIFSACPP